MMKIERLKKRLETLYLAIESIENGAQEYRIGTRSVKKADLATLYKERDRLEEEEKKTRNTAVSVAVFTKNKEYETEFFR